MCVWIMKNVVGAFGLAFAGGREGGIEGRKRKKGKERAWGHLEPE